MLLESDARTPIGGRVLTADGLPVSGATVTWTILERTDLDLEPAWTTDDWGSLGRDSYRTESGGGGEYGFSVDEIPNDFGSVLWASKPGHGIRSILLDPGVAPDVDLVLLESARVLVRVSQNGQPVADAEVVQFGSPSGEADLSTSDLLVSRQLHRVAHTDQAGHAVFVSPPCEAVYQAVLGGSRSRAIPADGRTTIDLELLDTFEVGGDVILPDWTHLDYEGERRLTVDAMFWRIPERVAVLRDIQAGQWGSIEIPLLPGATSYRVRLEGSPIIPVQTDITPGKPGEYVRVDLVAGLGHDVWFYPVDAETQDLIPNGTATLHWEEDGVWNRVERQARSDGYINVWSLPAGRADYLVSAPGYATRSGAVVIPSDTTLELDLDPAGGIRGRCMYGGEPVPTFMVTVWPPRWPDERTNHYFANRADGRFVIDNVPLGRVRVTASTERLPAPFARLVEVTESSVEEVTIDLTSPKSGRGTVLDARSSEPVRGAELQMYIAGDWTGVTPWGPPVLTDGRGEFEVAGFVEGPNHFIIDAEGYGVAHHRRRLDAEDDSVDLGRFVLHPEGKFEMQLLLPRGGNSSGFDVRIRGVGTDRTLHFDEDGLARYMGVTASDHEAVLHRPEAGRSEFFRRLVKPGEDWLLVRDLTVDNSLRVELVETERMRLRDVETMVLSYAGSDGVETYFQDRAAGGAGTALFRSIESDEYELVVTGSAGQAFVTHSGRIGLDEHQTLSIPLEPNVVSVRVLGPSGSPIPQAYVGLHMPLRTLSPSYAFTNAEGECVLPRPESVAVLAEIQHGEHGYVGGIPCRVDSEDLDLVLNAASRLELRVMDGSTPIEDARVSIMRPSGPFPYGNYSTDGSGELRIDHLGAATYRLSVSRYDCWPAETLVASREEPGSDVIQLRRLGDLILELRDQDGLPIPHQPLALTSIEFETDVQSWLDEGRVASDTGLTTDTSGSLHLRGLPNGPYRWSLTTTAGVREGTLRVGVGPATPVELRLDSR